MVISHKDFNLNFNPPYRAISKIRFREKNEQLLLSKSIGSLPTILRIRDPKVLEKLKIINDEEESLEPIFNLTARIEYPEGNGTHLREIRRKQISRTNYQRFFVLHMDEA